MFEQSPEENNGKKHKDTWGRAFRQGEIASAKALKWQHIVPL